MSQKIGHAHPPISIDNFRLISEPAHKTPLLNQFLSLLYCSDPSGWSSSSGGLPAGFSVKCHRLSGGLSLGFTLCHRFFSWFGDTAWADFSYQQVTSRHRARPSLSSDPPPSWSEWCGTLMSPHLHSSQHSVWQGVVVKWAFSHSNS